MVARRSDLRMISLDTEDHSDVMIPTPDVQHAVAVDYDPVDGFIYWTDEDRSAILRARLDGSGKYKYALFLFASCSTDSVHTTFSSSHFKLFEY